MRTIATLLASTAMLVGASAYAQTPSERAGPASRDTGQSSSTKPAVKSSKDTTAGAPVSGANSFTESQAKSRIEARGYGNVTSLRKDEQGVWHATASKGGKQTQVALDYQGNVVEGTGSSTGSSSSGSSMTTPPSSSSSPTMPNTATPSPSTPTPSTTPSPTTPATPPANRPVPPSGSPR
jgi:hypothetical protein